MSKVQNAVALFESGFNCSQAIAATYGPDYDLSVIDSLKVSSGFGAGMRRAEVCGAVTGALMVLGLKYGPQEESDRSRDLIYAKVEDFTSRFEVRCGSLICREILQCDLCTAEGKQHAVDNNLFKTLCPEMVKAAAEILEELC